MGYLTTRYFHSVMLVRRLAPVIRVPLGTRRLMRPHLLPGGSTVRETRSLYGRRLTLGLTQI
jgi:hypothetical protein